MEVLQILQCLNFLFNVIMYLYSVIGTDTEKLVEMIR